MAAQVKLHCRSKFVKLRLFHIERRRNISVAAGLVFVCPAMGGRLSRGSELLFCWTLLNPSTSGDCNVASGRQVVSKAVVAGKDRAQ